MKRISHVAQSPRTRTTGSSEKKSSLRAVEVERNSTLNPLAGYSSYLAASFVIPSNIRFRAKSASEIARFLPRNLNICARERHSEGWFTYVRNTLCRRKWFSRRFDVRDSGEYFRTATRRPTRVLGAFLTRPKQISPPDYNIAVGTALTADVEHRF